MKRAGKLFDTLISDDNLLLAIDEVNRTHHWNRGHKPNTCTAWVEETKAQRVEDLRRILVGGFEPKNPMSASGGTQTPGNGAPSANRPSGPTSTSTTPSSRCYSPG